MDQIFDFLFSNPLLAFLIIGALFSFFKGSSNSAEEQKKKQAEQQRRQNQQRQSQRQQSTSRTATTESRTGRSEHTSASEGTNKRTSPLRGLKETIEREISKVLDERPEELEVSIPTNAQKEAEERLTIRKDKENVYENRGYEATIRREQEVKNLVSQYNHTKFKKTFLTSLDKEGLINSVIMAEVLGKPRSLNPYQSPASKK